MNKARFFALTLVVAVGACSRGGAGPVATPGAQTLSAPTPAPTPTTAAFGRAFHRSFRSGFAKSFVSACTAPRHFGEKTDAYCTCAERSYDRTFSDAELLALGNGSATGEIRSKASHIVSACEKRAGVPEAQRTK